MIKSIWQSLAQNDISGRLLYVFTNLLMTENELNHSIFILSSNVPTNEKCISILFFLQNETPKPPFFNETPITQVSNQKHLKWFLTRLYHFSIFMAVKSLIQIYKYTNSFRLLWIYHTIPTQGIIGTTLYRNMERIK